MQERLPSKPPWPNQSPKFNKAEGPKKKIPARKIPGGDSLYGSEVVDCLTANPPYR